MEKQNKYTHTKKNQEEKRVLFAFGANTCISCGTVIPEGLLVCPECEYGKDVSRCRICHRLTGKDRSVCQNCEETLFQSGDKKFKQKNLLIQERRSAILQKNTSLKKTAKTVTVSIVIAAVLLLLSILLLALLPERESGTSSSPDNIIGEFEQTSAVPSEKIGLRRLQAEPSGVVLLASSSSEKITLSWWGGYDAEKTFSIGNMMPGDSVTKEYAVTVRSKTAVSLVFETEITRNSALAQALIFTIEANNTPLYSDTLANMDAVSYPLQSGLSSQEVTYKITAKLDESVGNEYANLSLSVSFLWTLSETESNPPVITTEPPESTTEPHETTPNPPSTFGTCKDCVF